MTNSSALTVDDFLGVDWLQGRSRTGRARYHGVNRGAETFEYVLSKHRSDYNNYNKMMTDVNDRTWAIDVVMPRKRPARTNPTMVGLLNTMAKNSLNHVYVFCNFCRETLGAPDDRDNDFDVDGNLNRGKRLQDLPRWNVGT
jgi:hypothetical protein